MKRLGKVFLGMLCIILLFAYSHASDKPTKITPKNNEVTFEWDHVEKYKNVGEVKYSVYVYKANNEDEKPPIHKEEIDKTKLREESPIPIEDSSCKISFSEEDKGHYFFLGVQTILYKKVSKDVNPIVESSTISWSCSKTCGPNPQYVYVPK